ncbi:unnamed protein product [Paramecium sonneborni]|uniref:Uncharacterized protein n=1 Tax=Paramecium sonneborni TaxID=65129 RepID=A0A8S1R6W8_9CILI|nr:unnamed protein product [Paramecium sonneborni]
MSKMFDTKQSQNPKSLRIQSNKLESILYKIQNQKFLNKNDELEKKSPNQQQFSKLVKRTIFNDFCQQSLTSRRITQFQNDNVLNQSNIKASYNKLPQITQKLKTISKANYSQERISQILQKSEIPLMKKRMITDSEEINLKDQLNIKKLNEQLSNQLYQQNQILFAMKKSSFPEVSELNDLSKQMDYIYKKNNINPLKIKVCQMSQSPRDKKNQNQSIEFLIKLLKETSRK